MLNKSGINKTTLTAPKQILANVELQASVGCIIAQAAGGDAVNGVRTAKAGTPLYGDFEARLTPFVAETTVDTGIKGIYTVQITTAGVAGDKLVIEGVTYECAAVEDVAAKKFAGSTAALQVTSLLKMVAAADFVAAAVDGATDKIKLTQKVAKTGDLPVVTVTQAAEDGALVIGDVTQVTAADTGMQTSNANAVLLHDVDVTVGNANATALVFGFVNTDMLDAGTKAKITPAVKAALNAKVTFMKV